MRSLLLVLTLLFVCVPATSFAQGDTDAVKLFKEGREAIERGDYNLACAKFEQSNALDKRVGTMLNLALCEEERTRLVRALEIWHQAAALAKRLSDKREQEATDRATQLDPRVPRLTLTLPADAPSGTTVAIEGLTLPKRTLDAGELSKPLLVDPGKLQIFVKSAKGAVVSQTITLAEGEKKAITLELPDPEADAPDPVPGGPDQPPPDAGVSPLPIAGAVVGGVGLVGVGVSLGFGAVAKSKRDDYTTDAPLNQDTTPVCNSANLCNPSGKVLNDEARSAATVSTIAMVVGGVLVAGGVTLIVISLTTGGEENAPTAANLRVGVNPTGLDLGLTW